MRFRGLVTGVGIACVVAGGILAARIPAFYLHSQIEGGRLVEQATALVTNSTPNRTVSNTASDTRSNNASTTQTHAVNLANSTADNQATVVNQPKESTRGNTASGSTPPGTQTPSSLVSTIPLANPKNQKLFALLQIPHLNLKAPVVQGTDDTVLNSAVGHLSDSPLPGQPGFTVLAAHNATWFRHVDKLTAGDTITVQTASATYTYAVTSHEIVHTGQSFPATAQSQLILESCYPLSALYLTPKRYLVFAKLATVTASSQSLQAKNQAVSVQAKVPVDLQTEGLLLHQNALPLGTIRYVGQPSDSFTQSDVPLQVTNTMIQLIEAYLHAESEQKTADLKSLLPAANPSEFVTNPFFGVPLSDVTFTDLLSFDLTLKSKDVLQTVRARTTIRIGGKPFGLDIQAKVSPVSPTSAQSSLWLKLTQVSIQPKS